MVQEINRPYVIARIKFVKLGNLQYISHLDLVRTMHKVLIRTKLPLWYSEGFNPKPKMVFSLPLSIGVQSVCEYMDVRLTERVSEQQILNLINDNVTDELKALEVYYPTTSLSEIKWYLYTVKIKTENASEELAMACDSVLNSSPLVVEKKGKKGVSEVDISPMISFATAVLDSGLIKLSLKLSADSSAPLNPELVVKLLKNKCGILSSDNLLEEYYITMRECAYFEDMSPYK